MQDPSPVNSLEIITWTDLISAAVFGLLVIAIYWICTKSPVLRFYVFRLVYFLSWPAVFFSFILTRIERWLTSPKWIIKGKCLKCGDCCKLLAMGIPPFAINRLWIQNVIRWYYEENYGFVFQGIDDARWLVFTCTNLGKDHLCRIYFRRPGICREYPSSYSNEPPNIVPSCGFKRVDGKGNCRSDDSQ